MSFGAKLTKLRVSKAMTQEMLAHKCQVSPQAVSKWERNLSLPDISLLATIADIFDVSIDELLDHKTRDKSLDESVKATDEPKRSYEQENEGAADDTDTQTSSDFFPEGSSIQITKDRASGRKSISIFKKMSGLGNKEEKPKKISKLHIQILSAKQDEVSVNVPIRMIKMGAALADFMHIDGDEMSLHGSNFKVDDQNIDLKELAGLLEFADPGTFIDITSKNGDRVKIDLD